MPRPSQRGEVGICAAETKARKEDVMNLIPPILRTQPRLLPQILNKILFTAPATSIWSLCLVLISFCIFPVDATAQTPGTATVSVSGWDTNGDYGVLYITVNGFTDGTPYPNGSYPGFPAQYLTNTINLDNPYVSATWNNDLYNPVITLTAKTAGSNTNYPLSVEVYSQAQITPPGMSMTASGPTLTGGSDAPAPIQGFFNPKYIILGVTYAPPGAQSNVNYTNSTMVGNTTDIKNSFSDQKDFSITVSHSGEAGLTIGSWSVVGGVGKLGTTFSTSYTIGSNDASTITINKTTSQSDRTAGPADSFVGIDHDYDVIWLWLNAVLPAQVDPNVPGKVTWNGYGFDPTDQPDMDVFPVFVGWLNGHLPLPGDAAAVLARSWAANQIRDAGQVPGLTGPGPGTDFETIGKADPFWLCTPQPANCPTSVDTVRFTVTANQNLVYEQAPVGGQPITQTYTQIYSNTDAEGQGTSTSFSEGIAFEQEFGASLFFIDFTTNLKESKKLTWTHSVMKTMTNNTTSQAVATITGPTCTVPNGANFCSPEYNGAAEFVVYQDNQYGTFMFFPVTIPRFRLAATPASQKTSVGDSTTFAISSTALDGFSGNVTLDVAGLPANTTGVFTSNPIAGAGGSSTLTITTNPATTPGTYPLTITGTSGTIVYHIPVTLVVQDFFLTATPGSATVNAPGTATYTVTASGLNGAGFNASITPSVSGLPAGATATFSPNPLPGASVVTMTVTVPASAPVANYALTITGTSGALSHSTQVNLTVIAPDFSISATPSTQTVTAGGNTTYTISTSAINGFTGSVSLGTSGLPTGASASFSPASISGSTTSTLTISTLSSTPAATYTITITGISGSINHSTAVLLTVNAPTGGVTISAPANNSNQSTSVRVTASATETGTQIAQMQVWDNTTGVRLGINNGSTIDQTYTLAPGTHQIIVEDLAAGTFAVIHTSSVTITVFANGVHITAPTNNASITGPVHVTGFATEAGTQIAQMQVWDNTTGVRLGINNGSTIDQTYTLAAGTHQIIMEDLAAGTFAVIHTASVTVTVH
jgi:hypothetical protein